MPPTHILWDQEHGPFDDDKYMGSPGYVNRPLPFICVNESLGEFLNDTRDDTELDGDIHQEYYKGTVLDPGVDAYNAIGELNIDESPNDEFIIISNRYDGMWGQTPGDSGIGTAMVLSLAKHLKNLQQNYSIDPKYNITFLFTTGEEMGFRGAYYHRDKLNDSGDLDKVKMWIGTDQLCQNQNDLVLAPELRSPNDGENAYINQDIIWAIANDTRYEDRSGYDFEPSVQNTTGGSEDAVWGKDVCDSIVFVKDNARAWDRWHATGDNYTNGDSLDYTDSDDVNLTYEMLWNITKYFTVDPDCWFSNVTYEAIDSQGDGDTLPDSIRANFTINSILPHDLNRVEVILNESLEGEESQDTIDNIDYVVKSNSLDVSYTYTIADDATYGDYYLFFRLYNSTGRVNDIVGIGSNNHNDTSSGSDIYTLYHPFGYVKEGVTSGIIGNRIAGSVFTANEGGVADNITAYVSGFATSKCKCMIYRSSDSVLIGTTDEITLGEAGWRVFPFSDPKPRFIKNTEYVLVAWSDFLFACLKYKNFAGQRGRFDVEIYGDPPEYASFTNISRLYSIYCSYTADTTPPEINNVSDSPDTVGFGQTIIISADVTDNESGVRSVMVNVTYPDDTYGNFTMVNIGVGYDTYQKSFTDTWLVGQYNYTIWAEDFSIDGNLNSSSGHSFNVSANATINIATLQDTYGSGEYINLTDPPTTPEPQDWTIENNTVYLDTDDAYLSATPHTMKRSGWTTFELLSKQHSGSIDIGFGLDSDAMSFDTVQIWKNYVHDKYSYTFSEETRYITFEDCTDFELLDIALYDESDFDIGNGNNTKLWRLTMEDDDGPWEILIAFMSKTILDEENGVIEFTYKDEFWIETITEEAYWDWKTIENDFDMVEYIFGDMNTWYFHEDIDIVEDHLYTFRIWIDVEEDSQGKYWWVMKPHNKNIQQAIMDGQFYFLDPWWDVKHITTLLPDGDGDTTDWKPIPKGLYNFINVDDDPDNPDDNTTFVKTKTGEDHDEYTMDDLMDGTNPPNNTSVEIQEVALFVYGRMGNVYIKPDWGVDYGSAQNLGNMWGWQSKNFSTVLNGSAITVSNIDDMIYDLKKQGSQGSDCEVSAVYVEVAWNYIHPFEINYTNESPVDTSIGNKVDGDGITTSIDVSYWASSDVVLYESYTDAVSDEGSVYSSIVRGQTFTVDETFDIVNVSLKLKKIGSPSGDLRLDVYEVDVSEEPTGESLTSVVINASDVSSVFDWVDFIVDPYELEDGEMYAFVLNFSDGDSSNYINWSCDFDSGDYGDGEMLYSTDGGSSWGDPGEEADGLFKIYGITGEYYDLSFLSNSSGSWVEYGNVRVLCNGSYSVKNSNFSNFSSLYWWRLNASNSRGWDESEIFKFSTRNQSKIKNTGSTNISGYLLIQVQYDDSGEWVVDNDTINETTTRIINVGDPPLALDLIFNGNVTTDDLVNGDGTYRVYAAFRDEYGDVLICDDEFALEAWYEFEVDTS